jgi:hypothetical protein
MLSRIMYDFLWSLEEQGALLLTKTYKIEFTFKK